MSTDSWQRGWNLIDDRSAELDRLGPMFAPVAGPFILAVRLTDLAAAKAGLERADECLAKIGAPPLDVRIEIVQVSALECGHPITGTVQAQAGDRLGRVAQVCRCCGSFRRRIGCRWGDWELSAPDVDRVRFPWPASPRVGVSEECPEGAAFRIVEVER